VGKAGRRSRLMTLMQVPRRAMDAAVYDKGDHENDSPAVGRSEVNGSAALSAVHSDVGAGYTRQARCAVTDGRPSGQVTLGRLRPPSCT
jgi:hypothetical protein